MTHLLAMLDAVYLAELKGEIQLGFPRTLRMEIFFTTLNTIVLHFVLEDWCNKKARITCALNFHTSIAMTKITLFVDIKGLKIELAQICKSTLEVITRVFLIKLRVTLLIYWVYVVVTAVPDIAAYMYPGILCFHLELFSNICKSELVRYFRCSRAFLLFLWLGPFSFTLLLNYFFVILL